MALDNCGTQSTTVYGDANLNGIAYTNTTWTTGA